MRSLVLLATLSVGCAGSGLGVVPRYPYVEDRGLALAHELLELEVARDGTVGVSALFHFARRGEAQDRVLTFPIGAPRGRARGFQAELVGGRAVPVALGESTALPIGDAVEFWDLWVGGRDLDSASGKLLVRYTQTGQGDFGYILKSGAYWSGPIEHLEVVVHDPHARVATAFVEGRELALSGKQRASLTLVDVEPVEGVRLELR